MKNLFCIISSLLVLCMAAGCSHSAPDLSEFSRTLYEPRYAAGFRLLGADDRQSVILETLSPWQGADSVTTRLFIARGGESAPEGFDGQVISDEARRVVVMSSTYIAMLEALDRGKRIVGVSGMRFVSSPDVRAGADTIADVGYDGNINYEALLAQNPDLVLLYGTNGASATEGKLRELGIPYAYMGDYMEEDPLGKLEWLVPMAEITGGRERAVAVVDSIAARYNSLRLLAALSSQSGPSVMLNTPYRDVWFMPSATSYMVRLITDAGGRYIYGRNTGTTSEGIDMEQAYLLTADADVWLNTGQMQTMSQLRADLPRFADVPTVKKGRVYNNNLRITPGGGNDFYESGAMAPDRILADLIRIMRPGLLPDSALTYYHQLR